MRCTWMTCILALFAPVMAFGGVLTPGKSVGVYSADIQPPSGELIAEQTHSFDIEYGVGSPATGFDGHLRGSLRSAVFRTAGGALTFLYDINFGLPGIAGATERSELVVRSFEGFSAEVSGALDYEDKIVAYRSKDGSRIRLAGDTPGLGGAPRLIVETDATAYDNGGVATFSASDEIPSLFGPSVLAAGDIAMKGVYRPTAADSGTGSVGPPSQPPAAIPLPPAAYSAIGLAIGAGILTATRRVWTVIVR